MSGLDRFSRSVSAILLTGALLVRVTTVVHAHQSSVTDQTLVDLESGLRRAVTARTTIANRRNSTLAEASVLADEITRLKNRTGDRTRADRDLEARFHEFDRLVATLDRLQGELDAQNREIGRLYAAFDLAANAATQRLGTQDGSSAAQVAIRQRAIEEARQRVASLGISSTGFRPVLVVTLNSDEGPAEINQKIAIVDSERQRASTELVRLDREVAVVGTRITLKRRLRDQLEAATRAASSDQDLLQRESDRAGAAIIELERQRDQLIRQRASLNQTVADLALKTEHFRKRLTELLPRRPGGGP